MGKSATAFGVLLVFFLLATVIFFVVRVTEGTPTAQNDRAEVQSKQPPGSPKNATNRLAPGRNPVKTKVNHRGQGMKSRIRMRNDGGSPPRRTGDPKTVSPKQTKIKVRGSQRHTAPRVKPSTLTATTYGPQPNPASDPYPLIPSMKNEPVVRSPGSRSGSPPPPARPSAGNRIVKVGSPGVTKLPDEKPARAQKSRPPISPARPPSKTKKSNFTQYTVKKGDTLWDIATINMGSGALYPAIVKANPALKGNGEALREGQELRIPILPKKPAAHEPLPKGVRLHTVRQNDTIWDLQKEFYSDTSPELRTKILELNPGLDPYALPIGKAIRLPVVQGKGPRIASAP